MTDSDTHANDEDFSQEQPGLRARLLSRLRAGPHAETIEGEVDRIVAQMGEFTIELGEWHKKLYADEIRELNDKIKESNDKIKESNDKIKELEKSMAASEAGITEIRTYIERRRIGELPAANAQFLDSLFQGYNINWRLLLGKNQQVVDKARQGETNGNASANVDGA